MPPATLRPSRRRRKSRRPSVPISMVRAAAYAPSPPLSTPPGQIAVVLRCSEPMMPGPAESVGGMPTGIKIITVNGDGDAVLAPIIAARLLDPLNIEIRLEDSIGPLGVYVPYNDPGFRGINGGMLNPGELSVRDAEPGPFPWCCAIG